MPRDVPSRVCVRGLSRKYPLVARFPISSARSTGHREVVQYFYLRRFEKRFPGRLDNELCYPKRRTDRYAVRPRFSRLFFLKTRARDRKLKYFDHLSTERPSKLCVATYPSESPGSRVKSPPWTPTCSRFIVFLGGRSKPGSPVYSRSGSATNAYRGVESQQVEMIALVRAFVCLRRCLKSLMQGQSCLAQGGLRQGRSSSLRFALDTRSPCSVDGSSPARQSYVPRSRSDP
jgi:hypothetical protein